MFDLVVTISKYVGKNWIKCNVERSGKETYWKF